MITLICPFCNGEISCDDNSLIAICPYCDSKVQVLQAGISLEQNNLSDLEQAVINFKETWNKANKNINGIVNEFYLVMSDYYKLRCLIQEPEIEIIEKNLYALERKLQKLSGLQQIVYYVRDHIKLFLGIIMAVFVGSICISDWFGHGEDGSLVAIVGFLMFGSVIGYIAFAFHVWGIENKMKSSNQPEQKAITEAINNLYKKINER